MVALLRSRTLVGRERELAELAAALDAVGEGAKVILLRGAPGIGKSRLCEETVALARNRGFRSAAGRCWETPGAPPYWPWILLLDELAGLSPDREGWASQLAELGQLLAGEPSQLAGEARRFRVSQLMGRILRQAADSPLLVTFEDLHAGDLPSLELLHVTIRSTRSAPVLWLLTARERDARLSPELATALSRLAREGTSLAPAPLGAAEVAALAERAWDRTLTSELAERVARSCEGNPLFVEGTLRLLAQRTPDDTSPLPAPQGAHDVLSDRLALLPDTSREPLELAAVIGRTFSSGLLASALGAAETELRHRLRPAVETGILNESTAEDLSFSHALLREALYETLSAPRRAELHWRVYGALRASGAPGEELAYHSLAALPLIDQDEVLTLIAQAAGAAEALLAWDRAIDLYRRALAAIDVRKASRRRAALKCALSHALANAGQSQPAIDAAEAAAADARELSDAQGLARAALASGAVFRLGVVDRALVNLIEEAVVALGASRPELTVVLRARLAGALQPAEDPSVPVRLAQEAIASARSFGSDTLRMALHFGLSAMGDLTDSEVREPLLNELIGACVKSSDRPAEHRARARLAMALYESGDFDGAERCVFELERLGRELGPAWRISPLLFRSLRALLEGRFADVALFEKQLNDTAELAGHGEFEMPLQMHGLFRLGVMGRSTELLAALEPLRQLLQRSPLASGGFDKVLLAYVAMVAGDRERARALFTGAAERVFVYPDRGMLFSAAMVVGMLGDTPRAELLERSLAPIRQPYASQGLLGMSLEGPFSWARGWLARARGQPDRAHEQFTLALQEVRRVGARALAARILRDRAELGHNPEDWPLVRTEFAALGLEPMRDATALAPPPAPPRKQPTTLLRDGDNWVLRFSGVELRLKDSRGLQMLALLVERPGVPVHSLQLSGSDAAAESDAGEVLDARARAEYRERVEELRAELDEALHFNDVGRAQRLKEELEFIKDELSAAVGLGGRARRSGSHAERARSNVQRRHKDALKRIEEASPTMGRRLSRAVKTGASCVFEELD